MGVDDLSRRVCEVVAVSIFDRDSESILVSIAITFAPKAATEHTESGLRGEA